MDTEKKINTPDEPYFGLSPCVRRVKRHINVAATGHCPVLLLGGSGTGKSLVAQWIHSRSPRKERGFMGINCSCLNGELLKSELFGHARGAFTGAICDRVGLIEEADGGTLFLDEIGDLDLNVQCQLLKAIEEKTYRRIGENVQRTSDFRLICATNRDLSEAVNKNMFREDLFYRINTLMIGLPSLEQRSEDIPGLLNHLLGTMGYDGSTLDSGIVEALSQHHWRGNIRELRNALERALAFAQGKALALEHFSDVFEDAPDTSAKNYMLPAETQATTWNLAELEKIYILRALDHFDNNKAKTSDALGISLSTLYRKMDKIYKDNDSSPTASAA